MRQPRFRLVTLGRVALETPAGEDAELGKRRRKLAVLAVLALSRRAPTRDQLAELFWGDEDEERARHSLSDALSHLRRVLGRDAIAARREVVALDAGERLTVDALEVAEAAEGGDHARVVALYTGPFLPDLHVDGSPRFDAWVARERDRLAHLFATACTARVASLLRDGSADDAAALAVRWLDAAPRAADAQLALLRAGSASTAPATWRTTLGAWEAHVARLRRDHEAAPEPRAAALATALAERSIAAIGTAAASVQVRSHDPDPTPAPVPTLPPPAPAAPPASAPRRRVRSWWVAAGVTALLAVGAAGAVVSRRSDAAPVAAARPLVAITAVRPAQGDTAIAWLGDGLVQMIAANLARAEAVDVVAPAAVRAVALRAGWTGPIDDARELELARRVHATLALGASVARGDAGYQIDVTIRDARDGAVVRQFAVSGTDVVAVADQAAAYVLAAAGERAPGPHLADVETASADAYRHFAAGMRFDSEDRFDDAARELDAAIALDSSFVSALVARIRSLAPQGETPTLARLRARLAQAGSRVTEWDRLSGAGYAALHGGEHARAEQLARELVARFPRDARAYATLADVYTNHGRAAAADSVLAQLLALDSLAIAAGPGPCVPCEAYGRRIALRTEQADLPGAEALARRWLALQPGMVGPWVALASVLAYEQRLDDALVALRRAEALAPGDRGLREREARLLVESRRYDEAAALVAPWAADTGEAGATVLDIRATIERERGQLRAAVGTLDALHVRYAPHDGLQPLAAHTRGQLGDVAGVRRILEAHGSPNVVSTPSAMSGDDARAFAWWHAVEADALAERADTATLRTLADSIAAIGARSYYGRDWRLAHHVRGLIAMRAGRWSDAIAELQQARWGRGGWTRTNVAIARAELASGRPLPAVAVLRDAYVAPLDAMGRYVPRSELDYWMAIALARAGARDSARVYAARVRAAWRDADADVRARLSTLPDASR